MDLRSTVENDIADYVGRIVDQGHKRALKELLLVPEALKGPTSDGRPPEQGVENP